MGGLVTEAELGALGLCDTTTQLDEAGTTAIGKGAFTGPVEPHSEGSRLLVGAVYRQRDDAGTYSAYEVITVAGGVPARTGSPAGATFRWARNGEDTWYGWDPASVCTGLQMVTVESTVPNVEAGPLYMAVSAEGTLLGVQVLFVTATAITLRRRARGDASFAAVTIATGSTAGEYIGGNPTIVALETGEIMVYAWYRGVAGDETYAQVRGWVSLDDGETWSLASDAVLDQAVDVDSYDPGPLHAVAHGGAVALLAELEDVTATPDPQWQIWQWISIDGGTTFLPSGASLPAQGRHVSVASSLAGVHVQWVDNEGAVQHSVTAPGQAFQTGLLSQVSVTITDAVDEDIGEGATALAIDESGTLWSYMTPGFAASGNPSRIRASYDGGRTWSAMVEDSDMHPGLRYYRPRRTSAVCWGGRIAIGLGLRLTGDAVDPDYNASSGVLWMGGSTTVELPGTAIASRAPLNRLGAQPFYGYAPVDVPSSSQWTAPGALPSTLAVIDPGWLRIGDSTGGSFLWTSVSEPDLTRGALVRVVLRTASTRGGGALSQDQVAHVELLAGRGSARYCWRLTADAANLYLLQRNDGSGTLALIDTVAADLSAGVEVLVALSEDGLVRAWWRAADAGAVARTFVEWVEQTAITDVGVSYSSRYIRMGARLDAGQRLDLGELVMYDRAGDSLASAAYPAALAGRPWTSDPSTLEEDVDLVASAGPTWPGDEWLLGDSRAYTPWHALPGGQGLEGWREDYDAAGKVVLLDLDEGSRVAESYLMQLLFVEQNLARVNVALWLTDTEEWSDCGDVDLTIPLGAWVRRGLTVTPGVVASTVRGALAEFDGCELSLAASSPALLVRRSSEGAWRRGDGVIDRIMVLSLDGAEDGSVTGSGSGAAIVPRTAAILLALGNLAVSRVRITVLGESGGGLRPRDDVWRARRIRVGPVYVSADEASWGRSVRTEVETQVITADDGTRRVVGRSEPRRVASVTWSDGVDTTGTHDGGQPNIVTLIDGSGQPLGIRGATPYQLQGALAASGGSRIEVVHYPRLRAEQFEELEDGAVALVAAIRRRDQLLYGRIVGDVSIETAQGDEGADEVVRVAMVIEEEIA